MKRWSTVLAVIGLVLILSATNHTIWHRQKVVDSGERVLLELRPVDPRSLMQGDYMVLRYAADVFPPQGQRDGLPSRGAFVIKLDDNDVATFSRLGDGNQLASDEVLLKYKQVDERGEIRLGAESYFFQEGRADLFNSAEYGVLHVDEAGNSVLVGLADENWRIIRPAGATSVPPRQQNTAE